MNPRGAMRCRRGLRWAAPVLLFLLAACAGTPQTDRLLDSTQAPAGLPAQVELEDVPFIPQEDLWCGPAALAMAVTWSGLPVTQEEMAAQVYTQGREGTLTSDMIAGARRNGRLAVPVDTLENLLRELAAGHPVIVFQNLALAFYPQWHYAVAYGYDLEAGTILLHSGTQERRVTKLGTFEHTWRRADAWALVVLPPDRLPATGDAVDVAAAAAGIERAGRGDEAAVAYRTLLARWPENGTAWLGLGNIAYGQDELDAAVAHYRAATQADPAMGAAWNNLAVALAEQGDLAGARSAAETALATADGHEAAYRETLAEIAAAGG